MDRRITGTFLLFMLLLYLCSRQPAAVLADEKEELMGEYPGLEPFRVLWNHSDQAQLYYREKPSVLITHPGSVGVTRFRCSSVGKPVLEGSISRTGGSRQLDSELFSEGVNELEVWLEYREPDQPEEPVILFQYQKQFTVDTRPPGLSARVQGGNSWHQKKAVVEYEIKQESCDSGIKYIVCYVNGKQAGSSKKQAGSFTVQQTCENGKGIPVRLEAWDKAGNCAEWTGEVWIDGIPPSLSFSGIQNSMVADAPVTVRAAASDENQLGNCSIRIVHTDPDGTETVIEEGNWREKEGQKEWTGILQEDGIYCIQARAEDESGLQTLAEARVILDTEPPVITFVKELDGAWLKEFSCDFSVSEMVSDLTGCTCRINLNGRPCLPGLKIRKEGKKILEAEAQDAAGNSTFARAVFIIDHTPPVIRFGGIEDGKNYKEGKTCRISMKEPQDCLEKILVNGQRKKFSGLKAETLKFTEPGIYTLEVTASDPAGNRQTAAVSFRIMPDRRAAERFRQSALLLVCGAFAAVYRKTKRRGI